MRLCFGQKKKQDYAMLLFLLFFSFFFSINWASAQKLKNHCKDHKN